MTEHHDDQTLAKVREALTHSLGLTGYEVTDAIAIMQNHGILFRERGPAPPVCPGCSGELTDHGLHQATGLTRCAEPRGEDATSNHTGSVHKHGEHGWHRHTDEEYLAHQRPIDDEIGPMPVIQGHAAQLFDGFHTMEELYDHRRAWTALVATGAASAGDSWRSKAHHPDDDPMFDGGYFIVGIMLPTGMITYHYKLTYWDDFAGVPEVMHAPKWDGATPADTVSRLMETVAMANGRA